MNTKKSYTLNEASRKLEQYCAYQERCHQEVRQKLYQMRMIPEATDQIIGHLIKEDFLNEERFARSFARGKFKIKMWGKRRIVQELQKRDISKYNIKSALSEIREEEYLTTLDTLAQKRLLQIKESNLQKQKRKLADYLLYRGWESDLVYGKVMELVNPKSA